MYTTESTAVLCSLNSETQADIAQSKLLVMPVGKGDPSGQTVWVGIELGFRGRWAFGLASKLHMTFLP